MSRSPRAFSPASVTGFFVPRLHTAPWQTVSPGLSFCLDVGVTAAVEPASTPTIRLNGQVLDLPPVQDVLQELAPESVVVELESPLPLGCGFGLSAASALSTAFAVNERFSLGRTTAELGRIAHIAEVRNWTGVGDVAAQLCGGIVHRRCEAHPLDARPLDIDASQALYYLSFGPLSTPTVLRSPEMSASIIAAGTRALHWLDRNAERTTLEILMDRSYEFAEEARLVTSPQVREAIRHVRDAGGAATMAMLGQTVLATQASEPRANWTTCRIDPQGTRMLS